MDLEAAVDELYAVLPDDFTAKRDELARQARDTGDKDSAADIKALRKPTVVAWLANQMAREHPEEIGGLLDLGTALREATATLSGPQLRELSRQRGAVVAALVREARSVAAARGRPVNETVSRELEQTFTAVLAEPDKAAVLAEGRLTEGLHHSGFTPSASHAPTPVPATRRDAVKAKPAGKGRKPNKADDDNRREARREQVEKALAEAWQAASSAKDALDAAQEVGGSAGVRRREAARLVAERRSQSEEAEQALQEAEDEQQSAEEGHRKAELALQAAEWEAQRARQRVAELQQDLERLPG